MARRALAGAALGLALLGARPALPDAIVTDANIVTGLDISDSVPAAEMRAQVAALASALRHPDLLAAIRRGHAGRIGVAAFAWHHLRFEILPWTVVGSAAEAEAAAAAIETRIPVNVDAEARAASTHHIGRLTDLSRALDHAARLVAETDLAAGHAVVNIVGNGADNMGEAAAPARDRLVAAGATVNGVVPGGDPAVADYYRRDVTGGAGAFVIAGGAPETLAEAMRRKLLQDLWVARTATASPDRPARN